MTVTDPGVQDEEAGTPVFLAMQALDSAVRADAHLLRDRAAGRPVHRPRQRSYHRHADQGRKHEHRHGHGDRRHRRQGLREVLHGGREAADHRLPRGFRAGAVDLAGMCMDDNGNAAKNGTRIQILVVQRQALAGLDVRAGRQPRRGGHADHQRQVPGHHQPGHRERDQGAAVRLRQRRQPAVADRRVGGRAVQPGVRPVPDRHRRHDQGHPARISHCAGSADQAWISRPARCSPGSPACASTIRTTRHATAARSASGPAAARRARSAPWSRTAR